MKRLAIAATVAALALLTFFQFPGHTWLQQDSQIYVPLLEHLRDPTVLRNDILTQQSPLAFTLYDETALALRGLTGRDFREVLAFEQLVTRGLGIWGLYLMASALGLSTAPSLLVAAICSLGAAIAGPAVLTFEYEPTPRAFAVPLLICAMGLAAHRRYTAAAAAAAAAFLYHPPTALPLWCLYAALMAARRRWRVFLPLLMAAAILLIAARTQAGGGARVWLATLTPVEEQILRMRAPYVWISTWPPALKVHWVILFAILLAAFARLRREIPPALGILVVGLAILGMAAMPVSWLLLERFRWALVPQLQPLRALLFVALAMQFLTAAAGARAVSCRRPAEALAWFALAFLLPLQPVLTGPILWGRVALAAALAALALLALWRTPRLAPLAAAAAFFAIPTVGGVVNYPSLHTADLAQLTAWARASTPRDAVFLFPNAGRNLFPGIFRAEALRAVYVDWKGGGQVNYLPGFAELWWSRWQQNKLDEAPGISYIVLSPAPRLQQTPAFDNQHYAAYLFRGQATKPPNSPPPQ